MRTKRGGRRGEIGLPLSVNGEGVRGYDESVLRVQEAEGGGGVGKSLGVTAHLVEREGEGEGGDELRLT
jgi:hypothetical protein